MASPERPHCRGRSQQLRRVQHKGRPSAEEQWRQALATANACRAERRETQLSAIPLEPSAGSEKCRRRSPRRCDTVRIHPGTARCLPFWFLLKPPTTQHREAVLLFWICPGVLPEENEFFVEDPLYHADFCQVLIDKIRVFYPLTTERAAAEGLHF